MVDKDIYILTAITRILSLRFLLLEKYSLSSSLGNES